MLLSLPHRAGSLSLPHRGGSKVAAGRTGRASGPAGLGRIVGMRGRLHHIVLDCSDADELAGFYSALLGQPVTYRSAAWVVVAENDHSSGLAFQPVAHYIS